MPGVCGQHTATAVSSSTPFHSVSVYPAPNCALLYANTVGLHPRQEATREAHQWKTTGQGLEEQLMYFSSVLAAENLLLLTTFSHTFQYFLFLYSTFIKLHILSWFHQPHTTQGMSLVSWNYIFPRHQPQGHHQYVQFDGFKCRSVKQAD